MCAPIAMRSVVAWLESQERIMRQWAATIALDPSADVARLERIAEYCNWLAEERDRIAPVPRGRDGEFTPLRPKAL